MNSDKKFGLLRRVLRAIGLSHEKVDDAVDFIDDLLAGDDTSEKPVSRAVEFPYHLRDHFLSPAELSFYHVLRTAVSGQAEISTKVALSDVFWVKSPEDQSRFRTYTNKIDRKHVDFLLCDPATMLPLLGIELDDKSHQRSARQERDAFVDQVFAAAKLPLLHVPAKRAYVVAEITAQLRPHLAFAPSGSSVATPVAEDRPKIRSLSSTPAPSISIESPRCPKCGSEMILRTTKNGANAGKRFWGCSTYPSCRGMVAATE